MSNTPYRTGEIDLAPSFYLPAPAGTTVEIQTYSGHNPDDKKMDLYFLNWPNDSAVVAAAPGLIHEWFDPGGIEINHGNGWFTTYMHMDAREPVGSQVGQGQWVGRADTVGTGAKHVHHEHLYRPLPAGTYDADTGDMVNPLIVECGPKPLILVVGKPITVVSQNGEMDMTPAETEAMIVRAQRAILTGNDEKEFTHKKYPDVVPGPKDGIHDRLTRLEGKK